MTLKVRLPIMGSATAGFDTRQPVTGINAAPLTFPSWQGDEWIRAAQGRTPLHAAPFEK
jgi:hypothetical protein